MNPLIAVVAVVGLLILVVALLAALVLVKRKQSSDAANPKLPASSSDEPAPPSGNSPLSDVGKYQRRPYLLTPAEYSFYKVILQVLPPTRVVLPMVRLGDLIEVKPGFDRSTARSLNGRVSQKHLDFVVIDRATCVPVYAIELDDASHSSADRKDRDAFVDALCASVGLPLVRQPARRGYELPELKASLAAVDPAMIA